MKGDCSRGRSFEHRCAVLHQESLLIERALRPYLRGGGILGQSEAEGLMAQISYYLELGKIVIDRMDLKRDYESIHLLGWKAQ